MRRHGLAAICFLAGTASAGIPLVWVQRRIAGRVVVTSLRDVARAARSSGGGEGAVECWGDSLTRGGQAAPGHDFPDLIAFLFDRTIINRGVDGETSGQIAARMLARPSSARPERAVIWAGRNDASDGFSATERNIEAMVASLGPGSHVLVLGILNSDTVREHRGGDRYEAIVKLNERLRARYGRSYVPIRDILIARAKGGDGADWGAAGADVVPPSLRSDALHLNDQGQAIVAYAVEDAMRAEGW